MKYICPHCGIQHKAQIQHFINPKCECCKANMTKGIGKRYLFLKFIFRFMAMLPLILFGINDSGSILRHIAGLFVSFILFLVVEIVFLKCSHILKDK